MLSRPFHEGEGDHIPVARLTCRGGKVDGILYEYGQFGYLDAAISFREGVMDGPMRFYDQGRLLSEGAMRQGVQEGPFLTFSEGVLMGPSPRPHTSFYSYRRSALLSP